MRQDSLRITIMVRPLCRALFPLMFVLVAAGSIRAAETFTVQWKGAGPAFPWLSQVELTAVSETVSLKTEKLRQDFPDYPNGLRATYTKSGEEPAWFRVKLAQGYGFTFSDTMLRQHPYLWVRDLGIYASRSGTWSETAVQRSAAAERVRRSLKEPYVSCTEKYFEWTGQREYEPKLDEKIWDFVEQKQAWPVESRAIDLIAQMPEVDASYFYERFPDLRYSRTYLGWPDHNDEFSLWDNGKIAAASRSVGGDPEAYPDAPWQPRASGYTLQFGVGEAPQFPAYGGGRVRQHLIEGFRLIVTSEWKEAGLSVVQTNFAYPLDGEEIRTGVEPLLAWTKIQVSNPAAQARRTALGIEFTDEDFGGSIPLPNIKEMVWRKGGFFLLGRLVAVADPDLEFEEIPTSDLDTRPRPHLPWEHAGAPGHQKRFRAMVNLAPSETKSWSFANFYRPVSPARLDSVRTLGYERALERTLAFWSRLESQGAQITVPEPLFNNLYRTYLPRITINSDLDLKGFAVLQTGPIVYNRVWHHVTSYAVADYLARRGYFDLARRYLEPYFHWQGIPAPDSPAIKDWQGFFGAPPEQCPLVWLMYQGMILWSSARYYQLSDDRAWLDEKMPALLKGMDWVRSVRSETKKLNRDGSRPANYGWFPPGRVTDGSHGTSIFSDANIWRGMEFMTRVLESVQHPRAAEFRAETNDYRQCLQDGMRRAASERPLVRLNDDTWVPYLPAYLETVPGQIESTRWYAAVVDGPWEGGMLDTQLFPAGSIENGWLINFFEDSYSPMNPSLPDEPQWACHATEYLNRDLVSNFLYTLYSQSTTTLARQTLTTYEHRSWGSERVFDLTGWAAGYWTRNFTDMLCRTVGDELWLMQATPRRWMKDGGKIEVTNLQTEFGPISFSVESQMASKTLKCRVAAPNRHPVKRIKVRLRSPEHQRIASVTVNEQAWQDFDSDGEWVLLPGSLKEARVVVRY
jgi:hypothetical protein